MSSFTTPLKLTPLDDGRCWQLLEEFEYHIGREESGFTVRVPEQWPTPFFWRQWACSACRGGNAG